MGVLNQLLKLPRQKLQRRNNMWTYSQSTGNLNAPDMSLVGQGYSGRGAGLNNPLLQNHPGLGPIPQGKWIMGKFIDDIGHKGPIVTHLSPVEGTNTFGRDGFMIHGDNMHRDDTASEGCIILAHDLRELIAKSEDHVINVIA
jgi:hypothetical protein